MTTQELLDLARNDRLTKYQFCHVSDRLAQEMPLEERIPYFSGKLTHEDPCVRESALYGLHYHVESPVVLVALRAHAAWETNPTVKEIAVDFLNQLSPI